MKNRAASFYLIPLGLMALNLLIKGLFLSSNSVAGDEPFSIYHAQMDVLSIVRELSQGNNPPLYEILLHYWIKLFGISAFSVRFPSLLFSTITVYYMYVFGVNFINKRVAIYASVFFVFSNYQVLLAHEARTYALVGMLSAMAMYYYFKFVSCESKKARYGIALVLVNGCLIYAHYFGFFVLIAQLLHFILTRKLVAKQWKNMLLVWAGIILCYMPNVFVLINRFILSSTNGTWVQPPNGIYAIYDMLECFTNSRPVTFLVVAVLITFGVKYLIKSRLRFKSEVLNLLLLWFLFPFLFMFFISYKIPMFLDRYLMPLTIGFYLILAYASDYLVEKGKWKYIIPGIVIAFFITTVKPNISNNRNVRETISKVNDLVTDSSIVFMCPSWFEMNFVYYYDRECFKKYSTGNIKLNMYDCLNNQNIYPIDHKDNINMDKLQEADRIIFLDAAADFSFPENNIVAELNRLAVLKNVYEFHEIFKVYEFIPHTNREE